VRVQRSPWLPPGYHCNEYGGVVPKLNRRIGSGPQPPWHCLVPRPGMTSGNEAIIWVACRIAAPCWPSLPRLWCRRAVLGVVCLTRSPNARASPTMALPAREPTSVPGLRRLHE